MNIAEPLQQVDSFHGILIVATNHTEMMDPVFSRRFLFHFKFECPDISTRERIWVKWLATLSLPIRFSRQLAEKYELSAGEIRNVVAKAAANGSDRAEIETLCQEAQQARTGTSRAKVGLK